MKRTLCKTKRLLLEPMSDGQMEALIATEPDEHMKNAYTEMLRGCQTHAKARQWYAAWSIRLKDGTMVGDLCFKGEPVNGEVEIGYGIVQANQGLGYATEAVNAAIGWAFSQNNVYDVTAETEPDNLKSQRVLEKAGMAPYGVGKEGPRYGKEKPPTQWMVIYMALGMGIGASFGAISNGTGTGIALGMCVGLALGSLLDAQENKAREQRRKARANANASANR